MKNTARKILCIMLALLLILSTNNAAIADGRSGIVRDLDYALWLEHEDHPDNWVINAD